MTQTEAIAELSEFSGIGRELCTKLLTELVDGPELAYEIIEDESGQAPDMQLIAVGMGLKPGGDY